MNKSTFVWNDMMKLFLVMVPKGSNDMAARALATDLRNKYKGDSKKLEEIKNSNENGTNYRAGDITVAKTAQQAQQLGWSIDKLNELFGKSAGYLSEVTETASDFQFYAVLKRYDAKMLSISDVVQPETTVTVYDYLKRNITSQKQSQYFTEAAQEISKSLDIPSNVDRKNTTVSSGHNKLLLPIKELFKSIASFFAVQALYSYDVGKASLEDLLKLEWLKEDSENNPSGKFVLPETVTETSETEDFSQSRAESYDFARLLISGTINHIQEIDEKIKAHLTANWNFDRLNRVTLSILRISVFALLYQKELKPTIIIDEAIAISKEFGTDDSFRFINAILDTISKEEVA